ncbi:MAG: hypothetical protein R2795_16525 [Saprospiraceae bacterium]
MQLTENVQLTASIPRDEALKIALNSPILLLLLNQQDNAAGRSLANYLNI